MIRERLTVSHCFSAAQGLLAPCESLCKKGAPLEADGVRLAFEEQFTTAHGLKQSSAESQAAHLV